MVSGGGVVGCACVCGGWCEEGCEGGCAPSQMVSSSLIPRSLAAGPARRSVLPAKEERASGGGRACAPLHAGLTLVASAGVCAGPRGRQTPREAFPRETRRGVRRAGRCGREERGTESRDSGQRKAEARKQASKPTITPIWAETFSDTSTSPLESATPHHQFARLPDAPFFALYNI